MDIGALEHLFNQLDEIHSSDRSRPLHIYCVFAKLKPERVADGGQGSGC